MAANSTEVYNKLVRDKIPEVIAQKGGSCSTRILEKDAYLQKLEEKLAEELGEYRESKSPEELADLLEVMMALVAARGETWEALEQLRLEKREARGGFEKRLLLQAVTEKE